LPFVHRLQFFIARFQHFGGSFRDRHFPPTKDDER
jgi:hypothetical protein